MNQIFLGTPHRGVRGSEDNVEPIWRSLAHHVQDPSKFKIVPELIDIAKAGSPFLDDQRNDFSRMSRDIRLVCAYENQNEHTVSSCSTVPVAPNP